jgi:hypothetical protein
MNQSSFNVGDKFRYRDFTYIITEITGDSYILENVDQSSDQIWKTDKELQKEGWVRIYAQPPMAAAAQPPMAAAAQPQMAESLNGLEHYFLWCSHGMRVSSDQFYRMECLQSVQKMNFFIDSGRILYPSNYDSEWSSKYYEIILDIHRIMQKYRQPLVVTCNLDNESQRPVVTLPSMAFYGRQQSDAPYIFDAMGLYHYEKQPDGKFARGTKIQNVTVSGTEPLFYSDIFKSIKDYINIRRLEGNIGIGFFCCREMHPWYPHSTTRLLSGNYVEPAKYVPLEESDPKYWFLMRPDDIRSEFRYIFESGDASKWTALLQTKRKGCGINVLSILGFLDQHQGREIVACLPATGTTMFKICDYISTRYTGYKFGILTVGLTQYNIKNLIASLLTLSDTKYYTIVKLYQSVEHNGQPSEVGHTVILVISIAAIIFYDPQNSRTYQIEELIPFGYVVMDIILCNSNLGDSSRKMFSIQVPLKQRPAKWLSGGQISEENTQKGFKELYDFLDANPIEGVNVASIEENNDKIGGKYKRSHKKNKRTKKKMYKKYKKSRKINKKYKKSRKM